MIALNLVLVQRFVSLSKNISDKVLHYRISIKSLVKL